MAVVERETSSRAEPDDVAAVRAEVRAWLADHWDPTITLGEWWELLGHSGWAAPTWPAQWYGKDLPRDLSRVVNEELNEAGAVGPPTGLGMLLAGPTIVAHGTDEQIERLVEPIVTGKAAWCQLFSEPGAGSDLAGLQCRGVRDGDEWVFNGQKVWTSGGQAADMGMLIARTDPDVPKHRGISYFAISMDQPGIDVRPLREMTGEAMFNEVFLTDARSADDDLIGGLNSGWAVANTTLANERQGLGAGGGAMARHNAPPGSKWGALERPAGDFVREGRQRGGQAALAMRRGGGARRLIDLARDRGCLDSPVIRQDLMRLYAYEEIARYTILRMKAAKQAGRAPGPGANTAKLAQSRITRVQRDLGLAILGPYGTLMGDDAADGGAVAMHALFSPAVSIYGGSDQIQRNIIGERALGLPGEPRTDKDVPFSELKVGTQRD